MSEERKTGWGWVIGSRKWHYFDEEGYSLCKKWYKFTDGALEQGNDNSPDNCSMCRKKLLKQQEACAPSATVT